MNDTNNFPVLEKVKKIINKLKYKNSRIDDTVSNLLNVLAELHEIINVPLIELFEIDNVRYYNYIVSSKYRKIKNYSCYTEISSNKIEIKLLKIEISKIYSKITTFLLRKNYRPY
jgi:hypothetical protein